ncbi:hypothetical protein BDV93DRAFT_523087 [Ceratobasidium sp. AG-I]|nr:hypothetical protein BDV93DRAFT_523087 [Ceratobasidium sp. AG-I]
MTLGLVVRLTKPLKMRKLPAFSRLTPQTKRRETTCSSLLPGKSISLRPQNILARASSTSSFAVDYSQRPLDFISNSHPSKWNKSSSHEDRDDGTPPVDDAKWELRVGRAISIITGTLPDFFKTGLVTRFDNGTSHSPFAFVEAVHPSPDLIYARNIRLRYVPPERLPAPFPETLQIEGLPLYFASAAIVRTSLNTLYHDMHVALTSVGVTSSGHRERSLRIAFIVAGSSRVGSSKTEWDITSTYKFAQTSGLINRHDVNSIHPAPHSTVYDALQSSLQKLGLLSPRPEPEVEIEGRSSLYGKDK